MDFLYLVEFWKVTFLFLAVWFSFTNAMRWLGGQFVWWFYILLQAIGITGFIYIQWLM